MWGEDKEAGAGRVIQLGCRSHPVKQRGMEGRGEVHRRMLCSPRKAGEGPRADGSSDDYNRGFLVSQQWA